jgi:hypothetical protein
VTRQWLSPSKSLSAYNFKPHLVGCMFAVESQQVVLLMLEITYLHMFVFTGVSTDIISFDATK